MAQRCGHDDLLCRLNQRFGFVAGKASSSSTALGAISSGAW
jgi:hypothetical protein